MTTLSIPISKAGKQDKSPVCLDFEFNMEEYSDDQLKQLFIEGFKSILNSKMSKSADFPAPSNLEGAELEEARTNALTQAAKNLDDFKTGKLVKRGTAKTASKEAKEVITEAKRQCKEVVRDRLKAAKVRISTVSAKDITAAAEKLFAEREAFYIAKAKAAIAEREAEAQADAEIVDANLPKADPAKEAKLEAEKAARKTVSSAKQAGMTTKRAKGKVPVARKGDNPAIHTAH